MTSVNLHQMDSPGNQDDENHLSEHETVWRLLSHDAFAPAEAVAFPEREPPPHIAAYKISTALRSGIDFPYFNLQSHRVSEKRGVSQLFYQPRLHLPYLPAVWPPASFGASLP